MADKSFGVKELNIVGDGDPSISSPTNLDLNAVNVAISTNITIGGEVNSNLTVGTGYSVTAPNFYGDGSGLTNLPSGGGGGDTVSIESTATDILSVSSGAISADDAGADKLVFWDDSAGKLTYLTVGSNLTVTDTTIAASGGGGGGGGISNIVEDTTPQLGGDLETNGNLIEFGDSSGSSDDRLYFGADKDLEIYHDGSNSIINDAGTGDLKLQRGGYDRLTLNSNGVEVNLNLKIKDDYSLRIGDDHDLQIYETANDIAMNYNGTGTIFMRTGGNWKVDKNGSNRIYAHSSGAVDLYYNGSKKLETTNTGITVTGAVTATSFSGDIVSATWTLGANGSSHYTFTGPGGLNNTDDPKIYLARGQTYEFVNNSGGSHPFQIQQTNGTAYSTGVTNNNASSGTIKFEVPFSAPNTLQYKCTNHSSMGNTIIIYPDLSP